MTVLSAPIAARRPRGARWLFALLIGLGGCNGLAPGGPPPTPGAIASGAPGARGAYFAGGATPAPRRDLAAPGERDVPPPPAPPAGGGGAGGDDPAAPTPPVPGGTGEGMAL